MNRANVIDVDAVTSTMAVVRDYLNRTALGRVELVCGELSVTPPQAADTTRGSKIAINSRRD
jgi:hypothetical protein